MSVRMPDLSGSYLTGFEHDGDRLVLGLRGVRQGLLLADGEIVFEDIRGWRVDEARPGEAVAAARRGAAVSSRSDPGGEVVIELNRQAGPGEAYRAALRFIPARISVRLRPNLDRSLRRAAGFYPSPRDL